MNEKKIVSCEIIDGVRVITYDDNSQHYEPVEQSKNNCSSKSLWQKIKNWWSRSYVKPYVKIRDLADPLDKRTSDLNDIDAGSDGKNCIEAGVKIKF